MFEGFKLFLCSELRVLYCLAPVSQREDDLESDLCLKRQSRLKGIYYLY
jgi:hypothetical protein